MLKGKKVVLRPMQAEDINRQHEFNQDLELYGLDSTYPHKRVLYEAKADYAALRSSGTGGRSWTVSQCRRFVS